ncbi:MAG TPA: single-stranded DNA-binding protein, partial [Holophagaceae bacterium]|nr:single-stranded DNA-binding protein [Holophagaceae bacterium]
RKGKQVMIEGRIQYREYQDQAGVKKTACDIRCDNFVMLGSRGDGEGGSREGSSYGGGRASAPDYDEAPQGGAPAGGGSYDDDIPF